MRGFALGGKAGSGKDAFASFLCDSLMSRGYVPYRYAFAEPLKQEVWSMYGLRKGDPGAREAMVNHGDWRRAGDVDYFVKIADRHISPVLDETYMIPVITDVRRLNEYEWAKSLGLTLVRMEASAVGRGFALYRSGEDGTFSVSDHPSECELDSVEWDFSVWNTYDESLREKARDLLHQLHVLERFGVSVGQQKGGEPKLSPSA